MARTGQRTRIQDFIVTSGDSIRGEDSTDATPGGDLSLKGGDAAGSGDGGNVLLVSGATGTGNLGVVRITNTALEFIEKASVPGATIAAGQGRVWVRSDSPNVLVFTDDAGDDYVLSDGDGVAEVKWHKDTVQLLKGLGTDDGVSVGDKGIVDGTGNIYRATAVAASSSTWVPATGIWYDGDFGDTLASSVAQLAMDEALLTGFPGIVQLRAGLYSADVTLVLYSNMILRGMGYRSTLLRGSLAAPYIRTDAPGYAVSPTVVRCAVENLGIDAPSSPNLAGSIGIDVRNTQVFRIAGCHVSQMERGIRVGDETRTGTVRDCDVANNTTGVTFDNGVRSCGVEGTRIQGGTTGVLLSAGADSATSHVWVDRNTINGFSGHGVRITDTAALPVIQTAIVENRIESTVGGAIGVEDDVDTVSTQVERNHFQTVNPRVVQNSAFGQLYSVESGHHNRLGFASPATGERRGSLSDFAMLERKVYAGFLEDWLSGTGDVQGQTEWREVDTGGGTATWNPTLSDTQHPGVILLRVPNTAGDAVTVRKDDSFVSLGGGRVRVEMVVQVPIVPDGTDPFAVRLGLGDMNAGDATDGVYFQADDASANWFLKTAAAGVLTNQDSGVAVSAGSWVVLSFNVTAPASSVEFFIDGVSVGTVGTNIPSGAQLCTPILQIQRDASTAGTANRDLYVDFYQYGQVIDAGR